ncbi:MAG: PIN domain-containing protein [Deferrisomatales bacterium]
MPWSPRASDRQPPHDRAPPRRRQENNRDRLKRLLARLDESAFDEGASRAYGLVKAKLEAAGTPIGPLDTLLAAHALGLGATMVTNNVRELSRAPGLALENWVEASLT